MEPELQVSGGQSRVLFWVNTVLEVYDYVRAYVSPAFGLNAGPWRGLARVEGMEIEGLW